MHVRLNVSVLHRYYLNSISSSKRDDIVQSFSVCDLVGSEPMRINLSKSCVAANRVQNPIATVRFEGEACHEPCGSPCRMSSYNAFLAPSAVDEDPGFQSLLAELVAEGPAQALLPPGERPTRLPAAAPLIATGANHVQPLQTEDVQLPDQLVAQQCHNSQAEPILPSAVDLEVPNCVTRRKTGRGAKTPGKRTEAWVLKNRRGQQNFRDRQRVRSHRQPARKSCSYIYVVEVFSTIITETPPLKQLGI